MDVIKKQTLADYEIILVDSDSTDKTIQFAKPIVNKIINIKREHFSFGYTLNEGIKVSSGKFLVFLSAHCYPTVNKWLANLISPFKDKQIACVYGKQRSGKTTTYYETQIFKKRYPKKDIKQKNPFSKHLVSSAVISIILFYGLIEFAHMLFGSISTYLGLMIIPRIGLIYLVVLYKFKIIHMTEIKTVINLLEKKKNYLFINFFKYSLNSLPKSSLFNPNSTIVLR